jgi:hypothetical protein
MFAVLPSVGDALFAEHLNVVIETDQSRNELCPLMFQHDENLMKLKTDAPVVVQIFFTLDFRPTHNKE